MASATLGVLLVLAAAVSAVVPVVPGYKVIMKNLNNPRGITVTGAGVVCVAEAGRGGQTETNIPNDEDPSGGNWFVGFTGSVSCYERGRTFSLLDNLPSLAGSPLGFNAQGPVGIAQSPDRSSFFVILSSPPHLDLNPRENYNLHKMGSLFQVDKATSVMTELADFVEYELAFTPLRNETNLNGLVYTGDRPSRRYFVVADAGADRVYRAYKDGRITVLAEFPPFMGTNPFTGQPMPIATVPTCVAIGPGRDVFVGLLTGFPFPVGGASVYRIKDRRAGVQVELYATGFTMILGIAFDNRGNLYVLEFSSEGILSQNNPQYGSLIRVAPDGTRTTVLKELTNPGGLAIGGGFAYITNCGNLPDFLPIRHRRNLGSYSAPPCVSGEVARYRLPKD